MHRLPSPPHSKAAIDAAKLLNLKKFSMSSNMNMEHDSMVVNRLVCPSENMGADWLCLFREPLPPSFASPSLAGAGSRQGYLLDIHVHVVFIPPFYSNSVVLPRD